MDDVASARSENANLRKIQQKLLQWDIKDNPLAPLTNRQQEALEILSQICNEQNAEIPQLDKKDDNDNQTTDIKNNQNLIETQLKSTSKSYEKITKLSNGIESPQAFLAWFNDVDTEMHNRLDNVYHEYYSQLLTRTQDCDNLLGEIDGAIVALTNLTEEYNFVSDKTSSLNTASEQLIQEQRKLNEIGDEIKRRLHFFTQSEQLLQRLHSPTLSVSSEIFLETLNKIDECLDYLQSNPKYKDAATYNLKYKQCLARAILIMKNYVTQILLTATEQVNESKQTAKIDDKSSDTAFAIYYGKFQASAPKAKRITCVIEERLDRSPEYEQLLTELHQIYLAQRANIMFGEVVLAIRDLTTSYKGDNCALVRSACAFMVHVCQDEHRLFYYFFTNASVQLLPYLEGLCTILYDRLRPFIIRINHLETLAEICSILRIEMLEEHVHNNPDPLNAFGKIANQLLQDVQERLVFRAHIYFTSDILNYNPSPGDLAYPEKLEMMKNIAISLQEPIYRRSESRASVVSLGSVTSQEVEHINNAAEQQKLRARTGNSPADLHGMWYPTVRRTLVCLSRLYRCIDCSIFQGLSQEALTYCIESVSNAAHQITVKQTIIDGELFEIKHLLILREQIAPFRVDFTAKKTSLDFSKVKTAAYSLIQKRKQLFSLDSNNAILDFLLNGTPQVKEYVCDSRKDVDRQLKKICEQFIRDATKQLIGPVIVFLEKAQLLLKSTTIPTAAVVAAPPLSSDSNIGQVPLQQSSAVPTTTTTSTPTAQSINYALRQAQWASPQQISGVIQEAKRLIKNKLIGLQKSMQLYLSNTDTEFILFRPIRNNVIGAFVKLEQILTVNGYSRDDLIIASCPSADQISVLLSSVSVLAESNRGLVGVTDNSGGGGGSGGNNSRKVSTSSIENEKLPPRKISTSEKKVSFDEQTPQQQQPPPQSPILERSNDESGGGSGGVDDEKEQLLSIPKEDIVDVNNDTDVEKSLLIKT